MAEPRAPTPETRRSPALFAAHVDGTPGSVPEPGIGLRENLDLAGLPMIVPLPVPGRVARW